MDSVLGWEDAEQKSWKGSKGYRDNIWLTFDQQTEILANDLHPPRQGAEIRRRQKW